MSSPGTPRFAIEQSHADDGVLVLAVSGELDLAGAPELHELVEQARAAGTPVRVDLRPLSFMDSSGLRVLLGAAVHARDGEWRFEVVPGTGAVDRIFDSAGVSGLVRWVRPG